MVLPWRYERGLYQPSVTGNCSSIEWEDMTLVPGGATSSCSAITDPRWTRVEGIS
jgi:Ni,Fe-hydrogenase I small subunit